MLKEIFSFWPIFRVATYFFFFMLLFWGGKNRFGTGEFHDDYASLEVMKSLRGFAAIGVIIHHISQEEVFKQQKVLTPFVNAGAFFVAIFFFCSGYGLIKSLDTKENYLKGFVKNRIVKSIILPFYINILYRWCEMAGAEMDLQFHGPYDDEYFCMVPDRFGDPVSCVLPLLPLY